MPIAAVGSSPPIRVLVVDDESGIRAFTRRVLRDAGYEVDTASSGSDALKTVQNEGAFDLFVIDEMMPAMRGRELAGELRQRQPDAKVLYFTGNLDLLLQDKGAFVQNEAVLAKPVSVEGLREAVSRMLFDRRKGPQAHSIRLARAISIRQPHVELILRGQKTREYRSRPTNIRERVYLYASLRPADSTSGWRKVGKRPGDLPTGLIVGSVEIAGCRRDARHDGYAYHLKNPRRLKKYLSAKNPPTPCFWRPRF